jgi:hypothetical protein
MSLGENPNENVICVIWNRMPKTVFVRLDTLKVGVYGAVLRFNDGVSEKTFVCEIKFKHSECSEEDTMERI